MAASETGGAGGVGAVLRDMRLALGDLFAGGRLDPRDAVMVQVLFGLLGQLARADGIVTSHEAEFVNALMDELELPLKARSEAMAYFEKGQRRQIELATELQRFAEAYPRGTEQALVAAIGAQLDAVHATLEARGIEPGGPAALRLFA